MTAAATTLQNCEQAPSFSAASGYLSQINLSDEKSAKPHSQLHVHATLSTGVPLHKLYTQQPLNIRVVAGSLAAQQKCPQHARAAYLLTSTIPTNPQKAYQNHNSPAEQNTSTRYIFERTQDKRIHNIHDTKKPTYTQSLGFLQRTFKKTYVEQFFIRMQGVSYGLSTHECIWVGSFGMAFFLIATALELL